MLLGGVITFKGRIKMTYDTMNNDATLTGGENPLLAGRYQVVRQLGTGGMCPSIGDLQ